MNNRPVLAVDFDGVLHWYRRGDLGQENIYDVPVPGALDFIIEAQNCYDVCIVSARASTPMGKKAIEQWLTNHKFPPLPISDRKPPGELLVIIDDRAFAFRGEFPTLKELESFSPWWRG